MHVSLFVVYVTSLPVAQTVRRRVLMNWKEGEGSSVGPAGGSEGDPMPMSWSRFGRVTSLVQTRNVTA
jgi:hypothetical protein